MIQIILKNRILLFSLMLILTIGCKKKEPDTPENPLNGRTTAVFNPTKSYGTVTDVDRNSYKTIKIGDQIWMAENLRVTHYRNGNSIPNIKESTVWSTQGQGAYCNYNNTKNLDTIATYGRLYNWYVTEDSRNVAPEGWRVANPTDWLILIEYLGGDTIAAKHLKEAGSLHSIPLPVNADNSSGFTAVAGGERYLSEKNCIDLGFYAEYWVSSKYSETSAPFLYLYTWTNNNVYRGFNFKVNGYSIRCIKE